MKANLSPEITTGIKDGELKFKYGTWESGTVEIYPITPKGEKILGPLVASINVLKSALLELEAEAALKRLGSTRAELFKRELEESKASIITG